MPDSEVMELYLRALGAFGTSHQTRRFIEECGEAITALMKLNDARDNREHVAEEIIGVLITARQMELALVRLVGTERMNRIWEDQLWKLAQAVAIKEAEAGSAVRKAPPKP